MKDNRPLDRSVSKTVKWSSVSAINHRTVTPESVDPTSLECSVVDCPSAQSTLEGHADRFLMHVRVLKSTLAYFEAHPVSNDILAAELARQNLNTRQLDAFDGFVSLNRYARFLQRMCVILDNEALGLECADYINNESMGALGGTVISAPNLAASVGALTRYMSLYADLSYVSFTVGEETAEFSWSYSPLLISRSALCDRSARRFIVRMRYLFADDWQPTRVQLQRERPVNLTPYHKALCPNLAFDGSCNVIEFAASDLHLENRYADDNVFELGVALAERMMRERRVPDDLSIRAREDIVNHLSDGTLTAVETARRLGMSTRVLQRRLAGLGTSYQKLCDEIRIELAQELLLQTQLPIGEIAYELGFSNQANFTRAMKRWLGVSPSSFRRKDPLLTF